MHTASPHRRLRHSVVGLLFLVFALAGCAYFAPPPDPTIAPPAPVESAPEAVVDEEDVVYRIVEDQELRARSCTIRDYAGSRPALILIHGGGFVGGSPAAMYDLCVQAAEQGYAAFAIEYRLLPEHSYPAAVEDAAAAVEWLRSAEQIERYSINPSQIAVVGSSAGAIVATTLGVVGEGPLDVGSRVAAVVGLSPVVDMTDTGLGLGQVHADAAALILQYLGCSQPGDAACPIGVEASPITHVDPSDSPALLINGQSEIVPWQQPESLRAALVEAGVSAELIVEPGDMHGQQLLTPVNVVRVFDFLERTLAR